MGNSYSIWTKLDRYPPVIVRLLAKRDQFNLLTDQEILQRSDGVLTLSDVKNLSYSPSWDSITVGKMKAFCLACGVDFADRAKMRTLNRYLRNNPRFRHLLRDKNFPELRSMLTEYHEYEQRRGHR